MVSTLSYFIWENEIIISKDVVFFWEKSSEFRFLALGMTLLENFKMLKYSKAKKAFFLAS